MDEETRRPPSPPLPDAGPFRADFWRSPLRGPWLASFLSAALLPLIFTCAVTGLLSHTAYDNELGRNSIFDPGIDLVPFGWPTNPAWLYAATQGLHIVSGLAAIPILLAKLWTVLPKLFERPAVRSVAHGLERVSLALLVGSSLFVFATGVLNIQLFYPFKFNFVAAHYFGAAIFVIALTFHIATKVGVARAAFRRSGVVAPLREDLAHTRPEPPLPGFEDTSVPVAARPPTMTRRLLVGVVATASGGLAVMGAGQVVGGPFRRLALLAPRGDGFGSGPNAFQVNKTFQSVHIPRSSVGSGWRLELAVDGERRHTLDRAALTGMALASAELPIACVEGWSTTQRWTGVRLADLAQLAGAAGAERVTVRSLQARGVFSQTTLDRGAIGDDRSLLALRVNGADLSLDHGFPARVIVPALPGVHCTKWVRQLDFRAAA